MKRIGRFLICAVTALALAGCTPARGELTVTQADETPTATAAVSAETFSAPSETAPAEVTGTAATASAATTPVTTPMATPDGKPVETMAADEYVADGAKLYRKSGGEDILVYSAAPYFPAGWDCWVTLPVYDDGAVYFAEDGMQGDEYDSSVHRIIRIDDSGRTVVHTASVIGYTQLVPLGSRIVFVQDGFDSQQIGWAYKDGSGSDWLDFSGYAAARGFEPYYSYAELYFVGDDLFADVGFFVLDATGGDEVTDNTVWIKPDMTVESAVD